MPGKTTLVSNATQLLAAAGKAMSGDTILLAAGNYGDVSLSYLKPTGMVTIKSADPDNDAVFKTIKLTNVTNLTIEDIDIRNPIAPGADMKPGLAINKSTNIVISGMDLSGSLNGNSFDDAHGAIIVGSSHVSILDSTFRQTRAAVVFNRDDNIIFAGNSITEGREGVNIGEVNHGLFERNYLTNMQPNYLGGDHPDNFQVQSGGPNGASNDLAFRNNVMIEGTSGFIGGIYVHSEKNDIGVRHTNISIENNYYQSTYRHGISVSNTDGLVISGNTVLNSARIGVDAAIMVADVKGALIDRNIAPLLIDRQDFPSTGVTWRNNIDVWDARTKVGIAQSALFAPIGTGEIDFAALGTLAGGAGARIGAGFHSVTGIGNLTGNLAAQIAAYVPQFDHSFATHPLV